jgi:hypothetical protein
MTKSDYAWRIYEMETGKRQDRLPPLPRRIKELMRLPKHDLIKVFVSVCREHPEIMFHKEVKEALNFHGDIRKGIMVIIRGQREWRVPKLLEGRYGRYYVRYNNWNYPLILSERVKDSFHYFEIKT